MTVTSIDRKSSIHNQRSSINPPSPIPDPQFWMLQTRSDRSTAAPRLVGALRANQDALAARDQPLCVIGGGAAHHADRQRLGDVLGDRQELRHRLERLAEIVLIEPGHDHALALIREGAADRRQLRVEELPLVDADHLRLRMHASPAAPATMATVSDAMRMSLCEMM